MMPRWISSIKNPVLRGKRRISVYAPTLTHFEKNNIDKALHDNWISSKGEFVKQFEHDFKSFVKSPYAAATSSGTAALTLALLSHGIGKGDEVIVPSFTMASSAFAVCYTGATPIFVDCDRDTYCISAKTIRPALTKNTKAIMPVHLYGNVAPMNEIHALSLRYGLTVIEDACEAFGAKYLNKFVGSLGSDATCFSLYVNKTITAGEGGIVTTQSKHIHTKLVNLNNYSFSPIRHFWHQTIGYNFRMSNLEAAIAVGQLAHAEKLIQRKKEIHDRYHKNFEQIQNYIIEQKITAHAESSYWFNAYTFPALSTQKLREFLASNGIETRTSFIPLHLQPCFSHLPRLPKKLPASEEICKTGLLLPSGASLTDTEIDFISEKLITFVLHHN